MGQSNDSTQTCKNISNFVGPTKDKHRKASACGQAKLEKPLTIALVAHDARKSEMVEWVGKHIELFQQSSVFSTGTTGGLLLENYSNLSVVALKSGPLGGDKQLVAMICEGALDALIFFVDPLSPMPHDVDIKAQTRLAAVYDLPMAYSATTANLIVAGIWRGEV